MNTFSQLPSQKRVHDLEERTARFAARVRVFLEKLTRTPRNKDDLQQLSRSSGSVAANYIEANESLGPNDFLMRIRICLKESKESRLWLSLLFLPEKQNALEQERL